VLLRDLSVDSQLELVAQFAQRWANVTSLVLCSVCKKHTLLDEIDLEEVGERGIEGERYGSAILNSICVMKISVPKSTKVTKKPLLNQRCGELHIRIAPSGDQQVGRVFIRVTICKI
jgi:hypothetical protein